MSSALAHHYFGSKERIFLAAMRHILAQYGTAAREALYGVTTPRARFSPSSMPASAARISSRRPPPPG